MTATYRTAAEAKAEHVARMGQELGELYDALWQHVAWLHRKWEEYVVLYGTKESRVELLNQAAPTFFRIVEDALWEDVLLDIACVTDPPQSVGKANLTVQRLPAAIVHSDTKTKVGAAIANALHLTEFCRDWRNRHIAHRALGLALGWGADPLKPASREKVQQALNALAAILNAVAGHYLETTHFFEFGDRAAGAEALLYVIDDGLRAEEARRERLKAGRPMPDDWRPPRAL